MSCRRALVHFDARTVDRDQWKAVYRLWRIVQRRSQELLGVFGPGWTSGLFSQAGIVGTFALYGRDRLAADMELTAKNRWLMRAARYHRATGRSMDYWKRKIHAAFPRTVAPGQAMFLPAGVDPLEFKTAE